MKEELRIAKVKYYMTCSCGTTSLFDKYETKKKCPNCSNRNKLLPALVVENDNCKDLANYPEVKVTGLKIKTRRN